MRTSQRPVEQYVCHWSQGNRAGSLWHVVPRNIGQKHKQPIDHIPHESHLVLIVDWDSEGLSKSLSPFLELLREIDFSSGYDWVVFATPCLTLAYILTMRSAAEFSTVVIFPVPIYTSKYRLTIQKVGPYYWVTKQNMLQVFKLIFCTSSINLLFLDIRSQYTFVSLLNYWTYIEIVRRGHL